MSVPEQDGRESEGVRIRDKRPCEASGEVRSDIEDRDHRDHRDDVEGERTTQGAPASGAGPEPRQPIDFMGFVASLATNALAAMGALPEEQARGMPRDPRLAAEYIDILAMLQDKTQGNLTSEEAGALHQLLADLRMQYIRAGGRRS